MNTSIVFPTVMCQAFEEAEKGSIELLEWAKEKAEKGCEATEAEAAEYVESAKETMEQVTTYIDFEYGII